MNEIVQRAKEIIISNEGNYSSVNPNDNGAVSIGIMQWHGNRAKEILKNIISAIPTNVFLADSLYSEIVSNVDWTIRILNTPEVLQIRTLLSSPIGKNVQDETAYEDIQSYILHIQRLGFTDEETIIFLADIENQGGAGASERIGKAALKTYGQDVTLDEVFKVSCVDKVFKKYKERRISVISKLTQSVELTVDGIFGTNTIKALQKFLKVTQDGIFGKNTIKALQHFLGVSEDGIFGKNTLKALQKLIVVTQDGIFGSNTIKGLQIFLNNQI